MTSLQKAIVTVAVALVAGAGIYATRQAFEEYKERRSLDKLMSVAKTAFDNFNANVGGMSDSERDQFANKTFAPLNAAFAAVTDDACKGDHSARNVLVRGLKIPELSGTATGSLGVLAGKGDDGALEVLLHPEKHGLLLSGSVGALRHAAENGNQKAIDFLAAVAKDPRDQPLWFMAGDGLNKAAANGNPVAIDALIDLLASSNQSVKNIAVAGLKMAAANQNEKAADALRSRGIPSVQ